MPRLVPQRIEQPGEFGVTDNYTTVNDPRWCKELINARLGGHGVEKRAGFENNSNKATGTVLNGTYFAGFHVSTATTIQQAGFLGSYTDVTGTITTPTNGYWKWVVLNDNLYAWQANHTPIAWGGSAYANLAVNSGTQPDGNEALAAFGRMWATDDDEQTIRYSALLDPTRWAEVDGGGAIDMRNIWTAGDDEVVALSTLGNSLVVFGNRHIVTWSDGLGNQLGVEPTQLVVDDIIAGTGAAYRDGVVRVGDGDIWFASRFGIQSLRRVIADKVNPVAVVSWQLPQRLRSAEGNSARIYLNYNANQNMVSAHYDDNYCVTFWLNARQAVEGKELIPASQWRGKTNLTPTASCGIRFVNADGGGFFNGFLLVIGQDGGYRYTDENGISRVEDDLDDGVGFLFNVTTAWFNPAPPGARLEPRRLEVLWNTDDNIVIGTDFTANNFFQFVNPYRPAGASATNQNTREEFRHVGTNGNDPETSFQQVVHSQTWLGYQQENQTGPYQIQYQWNDSSGDPGISQRFDHMVVHWALDTKRGGGFPGGFA